MFICFILIATKNVTSDIKVITCPCIENSLCTTLPLMTSIKSFVKATERVFSLHFTLYIPVLIPQVRLHYPQVPADVSTRTMARWLHQLGFAPSSTKEGVYIDGHKRSDEVDYRKVYLRKLEALESTHAPHLPTSDKPPPETSDHRKLVLIFHDESIFHSNNDQGWLWAKKTSNQSH